MGDGPDTLLRVRSEFQRTFGPGEVVFREGDRGDHVYVIQSGEIELTRTEGAGPRVVARLGPGDLFGELALVADGSATARAVATRRACVLELDGQTLESMCLAQPEIAIRLIRTLASRLLEAERRLAALGVDDVLRPVVRVLVRRAEPTEQGGVRIPLTLREVAAESGLSLLDSHRALHHLFDRKVLDLVDDCLVAPELEALSGCLEAS